MSIVGVPRRVAYPHRRGHATKLKLERTPEGLGVYGVLVSGEGEEERESERRGYEPFDMYAPRH